MIYISQTWIMIHKNPTSLRDVGLFVLLGIVSVNHAPIEPVLEIGECATDQ